MDASNVVGGVFERDGILTVLSGDQASEYLRNAMAEGAEKEAKLRADPKTVLYTQLRIEMYNSYPNITLDGVSDAHVAHWSVDTYTSDPMCAGAGWFDKCPARTPQRAKFTKTRYDWCTQCMRATIQAAGQRIYNLDAFYDAALALKAMHIISKHTKTANGGVDIQMRGFEGSTADFLKVKWD